MGKKRPQVGLAVLIRKEEKILFGKRKNAHGEGDWCCPGGHLEFNENWEDCARRETREEAGIEIKHIQFLTATNDLFTKENKHYITIFMVADYASGDVRIMEPHKCEAWRWCAWNELPEPLFESTKNLLVQGISPFDV